MISDTKRIIEFEIPEEEYKNFKFKIGDLVTIQIKNKMMQGYINSSTFRYGKTKYGLEKEKNKELIKHKVYKKKAKRKIL